MLSITNLVSGYGQSQVIHDINLNVEKNEIVAIMGRNGMGKTTLFKTLMGVLPKRSGSIRIGEKEIGGMESYERVESGIAYVPQGRMIFSNMTVLENIQTGLPAKARGKVPEELYALFPVLFDMRSRKGGNLSGGQQQQLAIARALATNPKVLLLDEPTEGIQPSIIKDIGRAISYLRNKGGMAILLVEQYFDFAHALADTLVVMDRGEVVAAGDKNDLDADDVRRRLTV